MRGTGGPYPTRSIPLGDALASVEDCDKVGEGNPAVRRTGRLCPPYIVENPRRTDGSDCGFLLAGDQNRSGAIGSCHRDLVLYQNGQMQNRSGFWTGVMKIYRLSFSCIMHMVWVCSSGNAVPEFIYFQKFGRCYPSIDLSVTRCGAPVAGDFILNQVFKACRAKVCSGFVITTCVKSVRCAPSVLS